LWKIALNLLAHCCPGTPVNFEHFRGVIPLIRGREEMGVAFLQQDGFVHASDIQPISAPDRAHSFRLLHSGGWWLIYSSLFGGRIGSVVRFAGPNAEPWTCADIVAPINSREWSISYHTHAEPLPVRVEWRVPALIMPSVPMHNAQAEVRFVPR
jgi:hypothetical protein